MTQLSPLSSSARELKISSFIAVGTNSYLVKDFNEIKVRQTGQAALGGARQCQAIHLRSGPDEGFVWRSDDIWLFAFLDKIQGWRGGEVLGNTISGMESCLWEHRTMELWNYGTVELHDITLENRWRDGGVSRQCSSPSTHRPIKHISEGFFVKLQQSRERESRLS